MLKLISERITDGFVCRGAIEVNDKELYQFGLYCMFNTALGIITAVIIGLLFNSIVNMLFFALSFIPVRVYSGGYHAKTPQGCFVLSTLMLVSVMLLSRFLYLPAAVYIILLFTSAIIIAFLSPTETTNRPLDKTEKRVYKKRTLIILLFTVSTTAALIALGCANSFMVSLILGLCCVSLMLVAGRIQNLYSKPTDVI